MLTIAEYNRKGAASLKTYYWDESGYVYEARTGIQRRLGAREMRLELMRLLGIRSETEAKQDG